jgi:hypothetical protein
MSSLFGFLTSHLGYYGGLVALVGGCFLALLLFLAAFSTSRASR